MTGFSSSAWLSVQAVDLQLREVGMNSGIFAGEYDPGLARKMFVALCFFRADLTVKRAMEDAMEQYRLRQRFKPLITWLITLKFQIEDDPASFPFSLNEKEFDYYSTLNFGGKVDDIKDFYKPPSFYRALAVDTGIFGVTALTAGFAAEVVASWAAIRTVGAVAVGRTVMTTGVGIGLPQLVPGGGSWAAAKKDRLWERYKLDGQRRSLP